MPRALLFLAVLGLVVYAVTDIASSDDDDRLGVPAFGWIVIVLLLPVLGAVVWIAVSRSQRARRATWGAPTTSLAMNHPLAVRPADQPVAPDDDPEFLWLLEQARLKKQREEQEQRAPGTSSGTGEDHGDDGHRDPDDVPGPGSGPRA